MSTTIDQRIVEMRFDNAKFQQNIKTTTSSVSELKKELEFKNVGAGLSNISSSVKKVDFSPMSKALDTVTTKISAMDVAVATVVANITNSVTNSAKQMLSAISVDPILSGFSEYETKIGAIQTIMSNTAAAGTSMDQIVDVIDELNVYADKTIYNFAEMTRNIGTFTAAGVGLEDSAAAIQGIANLAAASGSNSQQASTAMYQLSQALAAGKVQLMDWNSVVTAGMGGQLFQEALKQTAREHGTAVDQMIENNGSFRESLQEGWITADVLNETLKKFTVEGAKEYAKSMIESGEYTEEQAAALIKEAQAMEDAATKVKTFTQLIDTLKESLQSGWGKTWELLIGDFEEAKDLFTQISDVLGGMINEASDARNDLIVAGLGTGWDSFLNQGISDQNAYIDSIRNVAMEQGIAIDDLITEYGSFEKSLSSGWMTADIMSQALNDLTWQTNQYTDEQLEAIGMTKEQVEQLNALDAAAKDGTIAMDDIVASLTEISGRERIINSLWNVFDALLSVLTPIKAAFDSIFPAPTAEMIKTFTINLEEFTSGLKLSDDVMDKIQRSFSGVFSILKIGVTIITAIIQSFTNFEPMLSNAGSGLLDLAASAGDWLTNFSNMLAQSGGIQKFFSDLTQSIVNGIEKFKEFISTISENFAIPGLSILSNIFKEIGESVREAWEYITEAFSGGTINASSNPLVVVFEAIYTTIKSIIKGIVSIASGLVESISNMFSSGNFDLSFEFLNAIFTVGLGAVISEFVTHIESIGGVFENVTGALSSARGVIESYQTSIKADTLMKIATAIGILAGSLFVLSLIDSDKMAIALGGITVLVADLMGSVMLLGNGAGGLTKAAASISLLNGLAIAVGILSLSLLTISSIEPSRLASSLTGVTVLVGGLVAAVKIMGSGGPIIASGASQMVLFAVAIRILASAVTALSEIPFGKMLQGLLGVGVLLTGVSLFISNTKFQNGMTSAGFGVLLLSTALLIMSKAVSELGSLDLGSLVKGLLAVGALLTGISLFLKFTPPASGLIATGIGMIAISAAMLIMAQAVGAFGSLSLGTLAKGLIGMALALTVIVGALHFMPKNIAGSAVGLVIVGAALLIMSEALLKLGSMSFGELVTGIVALAGVMGILAIALNAMTGTIMGSTALILAAAAISILTPALMLLGSMSLEAVGTSLLVLAGAFAVIGVAAAILTPLIPSIVALAGSFALIGLAVLGIGVGLAAAGIGLAGIAAGITALAVTVPVSLGAIIAGISTVVTGLLGMVPTLLGVMTDALVALAQVVIEAAPKLGEATLVLLDTLINVILEAAPKIVSAAFTLLVSFLQTISAGIGDVIQIGMEIILAFLQGIANNIGDVVAEGVRIVVEFIRGISENLGDVIAAGAELVLSVINGIADGIDQYAPEILTAAGRLAGNLITGLVEGIAGGAWQVVSAVKDMASDALDSALNFFDINSPSRVMRDKVGAQLPAGAAEGVIKNGDVLYDAMDEVGKEAFKHSKQWIEDQVKNNNISATEQIAAWERVKARYVDISDEYKEADLKLTELRQQTSDDYVEIVKYGMEEVVDETEKAQDEVVMATSKAGQEVFEHSKNWIDEQIKYQNMGTKEQIAAWERVKARYDVLSDEYAESEQNLLDLRKQATDDYYDHVEETQDRILELQNEYDDAVIASQEKFSQYSLFEKVAEVEKESGKDLIKTIEDQTKALQEFYSDVQSLSDAGVNLSLVDSIEEMGVSAQGQLDALLKLSEKDIEKLNAAYEEQQAYINNMAIAENAGLKAETESLIAEQLTNITSVFDTEAPKAGLELTAGLIEGINMGNSDVINAAIETAQQSIKAMSDTLGVAYIEMPQIVSSSGVSPSAEVAANAISELKALTIDSEQMVVIGATMTTQVAEGMSETMPEIKTATETMVRTSSNAVNSSKNDFVNSGVNMVEGFIAGIRSMIEEAARAAAEMARAAWAAANAELDINSPSKKLYTSGEQTGEGFINALKDSVTKVYDAGSNMANAALEGVNKAVDMMSKIVDPTIEITPVISPVINSTTSKIPSISIPNVSTSMAGKTATSIATAVQERKNPTTDTTAKTETINNNYNFTQNNNSPKALNRLEIYRQTRNQFSALKGATQ